MRDAKLPLQYRDSCAHLLIPLNRCRFETWYMPWKCEVRDAPRERSRRRSSRNKTKIPQGERGEKEIPSTDSPLATHRTRDTATKSASTSSSRSVSPRWTSSGRPRPVRGATEGLVRGGLPVYIWMREKGGGGLAAIDANALYQTLFFLVLGIFGPRAFSIGNATNPIAATTSEHNPARHRR
jgi:hypothetical protein